MIARIARPNQPPGCLLLILLSLAFCLVALFGCATTGQKGRAGVTTAAEAYKQVGQDLLTARRKGLISDEQWAKVKKWDRRAYRALQEWNRQVEKGGEDPDTRRRLLRATRVLETILMEARDNSQGESQSSRNSKDKERLLIL